MAAGGRVYKRTSAGGRVTWYADMRDGTLRHRRACGPRRADAEAALDEFRARQRRGDPAARPSSSGGACADDTPRLTPLAAACRDGRVPYQPEPARRLAVAGRLPGACRIGTGRWLVDLAAFHRAAAAGAARPAPELREPDGERLERARRAGEAAAAVARALRAERRSRSARGRGR